MRADPPSFECTWDRKQHPIREVGFNWPDAVFALSLSEADRRRYQTGDNEDVLTLQDAHFVRGWAPVPVRGRDDVWGFGFWIQISAADFAAFERLGRKDHPKYAGRVANQSLYGAPTLGLAAEMEFRGVGMRPILRFTDRGHPLTRLQQDGAPEDEWRRWLSEVLHQGEGEPAGSPLEGSLEAHGWTIHDPADLGKTPLVFRSAPRSGETVKVGVAVRAADHRGDPTTINAGWWIRLDDVSRSDLWTGTLASNTRVPATIALGSRIWVRPGQVFEHAPAELSP